MASRTESIQSAEEQLASMRDHETRQVLGIAVLRRPTYWAMAVGDPVAVVKVSTIEDGVNELRGERARWRGLGPEQVVDLERLAGGDPEALDETYGFNNDELLRLGIGYGIPGPLSDEQVRREAAEILAEMGE